ncbi:MAG TPA: alpha/beta fold hydrolase [Thermoanaerobaculia bacterium]|nr:alpha/beta fold hydrolase [Thermoanaerobaculia bacterium]
MQKRSFDLAGETVRWSESGSGFAVVLVHGIPTSPELWRRVVPLVKGARSMALEMRGCGESMDTRKGRDISVAVQAERLLAWLDAIGITRAILVLRASLIKFLPPRLAFRCGPSY